MGPVDTNMRKKGMVYMLKPFEQRGSTILARAPHSALVVEVGVLIGQMSEYLLAQRSDIGLVMVDNWLPAAEQPASYKATGDTHSGHDVARVRQHEAEARQRVKRFGVRARIMAMDSVRAAAILPGAGFDVVFLDADHSTEGVAADIAAWLPKVKPGGWIGGHDYRNNDPRWKFGVDAAVDAFAEETRRKIEIDANFTWWARV